MSERLKTVADPHGRFPAVELSQFFGGLFAGPALQLTSEHGYVQLSYEQAMALASALDTWLAGEAPALIPSIKALTWMLAITLIVVHVSDKLPFPPATRE